MTGPKIDWDRVRRGDTDYIAAIVSIDRDDPADGMTNQAELYAAAGLMWARARAKLAKAENRLEEIESRAFDAFRDDGLAIGHADEKLASHPKVMKAKEHVRRLQFDVHVKRQLLTALRHRKDMLVQIGADRRAEMDLT